MSLVIVVWLWIEENLNEVQRNDASSNEHLIPVSTRCSTSTPKVCEFSCLATNLDQPRPPMIVNELVRGVGHQNRR
jgi:hypothetical protein